LQGARPLDVERAQVLCADQQGFSLHAAVRCDADERQRLEQLCRYITRPALANERVQINSAGQVVLKLKTAWCDDTTHIVMSPLEFMQRLAALVPRPRLHLIRFHGVLAPNAKLRAMVVPHGLEDATGESELTPTEPGCAHGRPASISWARLLKRVVQIDLDTVRTAVANSGSSAPSRRHQGQERSLMHLGLEARAPPGESARGDLQQVP